MDTRYQIFVSSTFKDLQEERREVIEALLDGEYMVAGMENFAACDEDQFSYIKKVIDYSDYYLLILAGKYGTIAPDGLSYTEKEYNYAIEKKIPVIVVYHKDIDNLPKEKREEDSDTRDKLNKFIEKAKTGRMGKSWDSKSTLLSAVLNGINKTRSEFSAIGWKRADDISDSATLKDFLNLKSKNESLKEELLDLKSKSTPRFKGIHNMGAVYHTTIEVHMGSMRNSQDEEMNIRWDTLFKTISTAISFKKKFGATALQDELEQFIRNTMFPKAQGVTLPEDVFFTILSQFMGHGLLETVAYGYALTVAGKDVGLNLRLIKD